MPDEVDQVMYACTGSEVNDLALRVAEMYTDATGVIVTRDAYHGNTAAVTAISPSLGGCYDARTARADGRRRPTVTASADAAASLRRRCGARRRRSLR